MAKRKKKPPKIVEYDLERLDDVIKGDPKKVILGCDPGSRNFGIALVGLVGKKPRVFANAVMMRPVNTLTTINQSSRIFLEELDQWVLQGIDGIVAERFQTRGGASMGPLIECVSAMIGSMLSYEKPVKAIIASQWKTAFKRRFGQDLKDLYDSVQVQPHQLDASLIGIYGLEQGLGLKLDWDYREVFKQVEKTSLIGLRKLKEQK
jgi:hypothetical protein